MIENTNHNKAVFMSRYWGQMVLLHEETNTISHVNSYFTTSKSLVIHKLLLTPLSMITDEHAIEVARLQGYNNEKTSKLPIQFTFENEFSVCIQSNHNDYYETVNSNTYNFLISKGYYVGDGTELEYKWCVLKKDK